MKRAQRPIERKEYRNEKLKISNWFGFNLSIFPGDLRFQNVILIFLNKLILA